MLGFLRRQHNDLSILPGPDPWAEFLAVIASSPRKSVLEVGTAQAVPGVSTHHMSYFPGTGREQYTMVDVKAGPDVDIVADLHALPGEWTGRFDTFVSVAVFEHLERPWIAAKEVARVLAPGGACFIGTHQTFPLHGYPSDYFRFSTDALALIFRDAGLEVLSVGYKHRCRIVLPKSWLPSAESERWNRRFPSYATVQLTARKP